MSLLIHHQQFKSQRGAAVMLFSAVLLFGITTAMVYSARVGVIEQKVTGNQVRAKQARQAANSGLAAAMVRIDKKDVGLLTQATQVNTLDPIIIDGMGAYTLSYNTLVDADPTKIVVTVNGKSEDGTGLRAMQQVYKFMPFVSNSPPATLVATGDVIMEDTTVVVDNKSSTRPDTTIICGKAMKKRGAMGMGVKATTAKTVSKFNAGQQQKRVKANVNTSATPLPTGDALFESFFTNTKANMKKMATVINCSSGCNSSHIDGLSGLVWIDGNINMNSQSNKGAGQFDTATGTDNPIVLIVDGNLKMNHANSQINGLVYVTQDWNNANGNGGKIKGGIIVEGNMTASGSLTLKYNDDILASIINNVGMYLPVPGTWKEI